MTRAELLRVARNIGCRGSLSKMNVAQLQDAIAKRRTYLATPAADVTDWGRRDRTTEGTQ